MKLTHLITDGLAAYRIGRLVVEEDSPVSLRVRELVQTHVPAAWQGVLDCEHCAALWAALGLAGLRAVGLGGVAYPLAAAAIQSLAKDAVRPEPTQETVAEPQGAIPDPHLSSGYVGPIAAMRQRTVPLQPRPVGSPPPADLGQQ